MPLDPRIILGAEPPKIESPLVMLSQIAQLQQSRGAAEKQQVELRGLRQNEADQAAIRQVLQETHGNLEQALPQLRQIAPAAAVKLETDLATQHKAKFDALKSETDNRSARMTLGLKVWNSVTNQATLDAARPMVLALDPSLEAILPKVYDPAAVERIGNMALTGKELHDQQREGLEAVRKGDALKGWSMIFGATRNQQQWDNAMTGARAVGEKPEILALFGDTFSPEAVQHATRLGISSEKGAELGKRTDSQQELDAFARSIGKPDASALTYEDRQTFATQKAAIAGGQQVRTHQQERQYDIANPIPEKDPNQAKLEQQYRAVLTRAMSSRSGGIGAEDAKVQQANHLLALIDASYDPKTGQYNIPKTQQAELALGLARLIAPGGQAGVQMLNEINQRTAAGDMAGVLTYLTGTPVSAATQDIVQMYKDSIQRQGEVAQQNREGEMAYLRGLAPTELEEPRRQALEATSLNPLRQSRLIRNPTTGERALQISIDGGNTWRAASGASAAPATTPTPTPARTPSAAKPGTSSREWTLVKGVLYHNGKPF